MSKLTGVAYDVSILRPSTEKHYRAGIYRATLNIARQLAKLPSIQLNLCAAASLEAQKASLSAVMEDEELRTSTFWHRPRGIRAYERTREMLDSMNDWSVASHATPIRRAIERSAREALHLVCPPLPSKRLQDVDVFHSSFGAFPRQLRQWRGSKFLTVYDVTPVLRPEFHVAGLRRGFQKLLASLSEDVWTVCISHATRADLLSLCPVLRPERAVVAHLAAEPHFQPRGLAAQTRVRAKYGLGDAPYLLAVNTLEPRKNVERTIRCFARMVEQERIPELKLVLVGARGWLTTGIDEAVREHRHLADRLCFPGYVDDEDLSALYSASVAFVYLSLYEGFGLPPLEAMQCGTAVIAANNSSLPEVVGDAGLLVSATDEDAICHAMSQIVQNTSVRTRLSEAGQRRAQSFSWSRCGATIADAYARSLKM